MAKQKQQSLGDTVLLLEGLGDECGGGCDFDGDSGDFSMEFAEPEYDFLDNLSNLPSATSRKKSRKKRGKCIKKRNIINKWGQRTTRCAKYGGSGMAKAKKRKSTYRRRRSRGLFSGLGQANLLKDVQPTLVTGGIAAAGAWASTSLGEKVGKMLNVSPGSMTGNLLTIVSGLVLGTVVAKVTKKRDYGAAVSIGAVVVSALNLIGTRGGTAGYQGLGVLTAEPAPYFQQVSPPPVASFPSASNLYTDANIAAAIV